MTIFVKYTVTAASSQEGSDSETSTPVDNQWATQFPRANTGQGWEVEGGLFLVFSALEGALVMNRKLGVWEHVGSPAGLPGESEKQKLRRSDLLHLSSKEWEFFLLKRCLGAVRGQEQGGASVKCSPEAHWASFPVTSYKSEPCLAWGEVRRGLCQAASDP